MFAKLKEKEEQSQQDTISWSCNNLLTHPLPIRSAAYGDEGEMVLSNGAEAIRSVGFPHFVSFAGWNNGATYLNRDSRFPLYSRHTISLLVSGFSGSLKSVKKNKWKASFSRTLQSNSQQKHLMEQCERFGGKIENKTPVLTRFHLHSRVDLGVKRTIMIKQSSSSSFQRSREK